MSRTGAVALSLITFLACSSEKKGEEPIPGETGGVDLDAGLDVPDEGALDAGALDAGAGGLVRIEALDDVRITSNAAGPNFQRARGTVDFSGGPWASAKMIVSLGTTCFPFESWANNRPPPGQRWPADCDAFDRNFEIALDPPSTTTSTPALELVRAITPFGGPMNFEVDVTDVANGLPGAHTVEAYVATWPDPQGRVTGSNGGWNVSITFELTPGPAPRRVLAVIPLVNHEHAADTTETTFDFEAPAGTTSARIEYRVTGHGQGPAGEGCIGPAEEFCRRKHRLFLDGNTVGQPFDAWRTNCQDLCTVARVTGPANSDLEYCAENPCGAMASVRAPRANWCPGSESTPYLLEDRLLQTPGAHAFTYRIDSVKTGGFWRVSATYFAFGNP